MDTLKLIIRQQRLLKQVIMCLLLKKKFVVFKHFIFILKN